MTALVAMGFWGWQLGDGILQFFGALVVPIAAAAVWGAFAVPGDASRSGSAPIAVSGVLRLGIEVTFFAFAARALYETGGTSLGLIFGAAVVVHYALSYDRIAWLLRA
ncbi:DUF2568 domain-containing protein [Undibacterium arcticum]|uniref:DUF2568 domain-containing protein n=1 Tax=Undibacterium arcticum TaxID=1762892 RepID=UPI003615DE42